MSPSVIVFLLLIAVEAPLVVATLSRSRTSRAARVLIFLVPLLTALGFRAWRAFSTHQVLEWDETYYMSLAVTGASGGGLYPYIYGFGPMPLMGGVGYAAYSYVAAVKLFGPTIFALRGVSLLVSILGLAGIWMAVRTLYGSGTAWIAAALTASLQLFVLSNTARMDSWTFAYVAWALAIVTIALQRWPQKRWHLVAGLAFGFGPQAHIDVLATAAACGLLYFLRYMNDARHQKRLRLGNHPMFLFLAGLIAGLGVYVVCNILPDPASYYTMTVRIRVDATNSYSAGTSSLVGSFLDPRVLAAKELTRYRQLFGMTPALEFVLLAAGLVASLLRRSGSDRIALSLVPGVCVAAAILLNNASPLYYIHVVPALLLPIAPLFSHGVSRRTPLSLANLSPISLIASAIVICALTASAGGRTARSIRYAVPVSSVSTDTIQQIRTLVDRRCIVAGDGGLYVPYFTDYPRFISLRPTEVKHGMLFYRTTDEAAYWRIKHPDAIFSPEPLRAGLSEYVAERGFKMVAPGVWINAEGCRARE